MSHYEQTITYACLLCPTDDEGYVGFETQDRRAMATHLRTEHALDTEALRALRGGMTMHMRGSGWGLATYEYKLPDGRPCLAKRVDSVRSSKRREQSHADAR